MDEKEGDRTTDLFIENSIALQKVLANNAVSMDNLTNQVKKLIDMFEEAGKSFVETKHKTSAESGIGKDEGLIGKLDSLVQQNKTIAKGLVLLEKTMREKDTTKPLPEFKF